MNLSKVLVRRVGPLEEQRFQQLMQEHHYLGALPKISETLWYIASFDDQWVAPFGSSQRDQWIGWSFRHQFDRLKLVTNNSRFLILPNCHFPRLNGRSSVSHPQRFQGFRDCVKRRLPAETHHGACRDGSVSTPITSAATLQVECRVFDGCSSGRWDDGAHTPL